jgi:hypothetical protein
VLILLCRGKLTKAWGFGGLSKHHSRESYDLFVICLSVSVKYGEVTHILFDVNVNTEPQICL